MCGPHLARIIHSPFAWGPWFWSLVLGPWYPLDPPSTFSTPLEKLEAYTRTAIRSVALLSGREVERKEGLFGGSWGK